MDQTPKFKIHSRHRKKNDGKSHGSAKEKKLESPRDRRRSKQETPVKATGSKSIADLQSCYQFIDSEPVIIWGSPRMSPSYELHAKQVCISTPQHRPKDKERFPKPMRRLIKGTGSPSQFLRDLMDFSEKFKSDKVKLKEEPEPFIDISCSTEVPLSVEISGAALSDTDNFLSLSPKYRPCPEELEQIKKDSFQALFDDGDDDIMLKCSQEIEEIICKVTNSEPMTAIMEEQDVVHKCNIVTPEKKGDKLKCKKRSIERTPKNNKQTKTASKRVGSLSSKKDGRSAANQSPRNVAPLQCKNSVGSETRKSPRFKGGAATASEESLDFGSESFEDFLKRIAEEELPDLPDSPQRKVPTLLQNQGFEWTPKNNKQTKTVTKRVGGSSSKKDGRSVVNRSPKNNAPQHSKNTVGSEKRKSLRLRGNIVRSSEEPLDFGCESFEDIVKRMVEEDFPDPSDNPQRDVPTVSRQSESACGSRSGIGEVGRRKGTSRSTRASTNTKQSADKIPLKSDILEYFRSEEEDMNESDLVKVLDVVESQTIQSSPPFKCTPEEILQKKLEAKRRLAKKKLCRTNGTTNIFSMLLKPNR